MPCINTAVAVNVEGLLIRSVRIHLRRVVGALAPWLRQEVEGRLRPEVQPRRAPTQEATKIRALDAL